jgi:hypothetical protein
MILAFGNERLFINSGYAEAAQRCQVDLVRFIHPDAVYIFIGSTAEAHIRAVKVERPRSGSYHAQLCRQEGQQILIRAGNSGD